jgi:anthraniloyl-CoA monooxygenase
VGSIPTGRSSSRGGFWSTGDIVDVSSGQVSPLERPAFGCSYQRPFADRIRNEVGIPTITVGVISSYDDVNTIVLAGRADLCALARPHIYDPHWTLHAAAEQDYAGVEWVPQYLAGARKPPVGREGTHKELQRTFDSVAPELALSPESGS